LYQGLRKVGDFFRGFMKKIFFLIISTISIFGQSAYYSLKFISSYTLHSVKYFNQNIEIAVGNSGTIYAEIKGKENGNPYKIQAGVYSSVKKLILIK
jgi:hypothetical protein